MWSLLNFKKETVDTNDKNRLDAFTMIDIQFSCFFFFKKKVHSLKAIVELINYNEIEDFDGFYFWWSQWIHLTFFPVSSYSGELTFDWSQAIRTFVGITRWDSCWCKHSMGWGHSIHTWVSCRWRRTICIAYLQQSVSISFCFQFQQHNNNNQSCSRHVHYKSTQLQ